MQNRIVIHLFWNFSQLYLCYSNSDARSDMIKIYNDYLNVSKVSIVYIKLLLPCKKYHGSLAWPDRFFPFLFVAPTQIKMEKVVWPRETSTMAIRSAKDCFIRE